jgi:hypothetical protein
LFGIAYIKLYIVGTVKGQKVFGFGVYLGGVDSGCLGHGKAGFIIQSHNITTLIYEKIVQGWGSVTEMMAGCSS